MIAVRFDTAAGEALARRRGFAALIHRDPLRGDCFASQATRHELARQGLLRRGCKSEPFAPEAAALAGARQRLLHGWSTAIGEPLPADVADEVALWLLARPGVELEYMGRGRFDGRSPGAIHYFDRPGGRRAYAFRPAEGGGSVRERGERITEDFRQRGAWLADPDARVVLSIGGGGYRLFAAAAAVKAIELMLGGDRSKIAEVWGSSGGAMLGYAFSRGLALSAIDRLGFGLYHGERKELPGLHLRSLAHFISQAVRDWRRGSPGSPELGAWVGAIDELSPPPTAPPIPFYSLVSNSRRRYPIAFAEPGHIPEHCGDFLLPCNSRDATAASMAVPFLFRPLRGVLPGAQDDHWFDGSVVEENPMLLPFVKWLRDRRHAPATTPKKLKIVLVNLNLRLSESSALARMAQGSGGARLASKAFDLMDLLLDSKTHAHLRTLTEVEGVEIMTATLTLGRMNFITRNAIPTMIRSGQIMEAWRLETFDGLRRAHLQAS